MCSSTGFARHYCRNIQLNEICLERKILHEYKCYTCLRKIGIKECVSIAWNTIGFLHLPIDK